MAIALTPEESDAVRSNRKILAIKLVRQRTHLGLFEAKNLVEQWDGKTLTTDGKLCPTCGGTGHVQD